MDSVKGAGFKHYPDSGYSQSSADPRPYLESGEISPYYNYEEYYEYSESSYSDYS